MDKIEEEPCNQEVADEDKDTNDELEIIEVVSPMLNSENLGSGASSNTDIDEADTRSRLKERIDSLQDAVADLKEKLRQEKELCRKEIDEMNKLQLRIIESNPDLSAGLKPEVVGCLDSNSDMQNKSTVLEYEKKLVRYQEALAAAQAEKRQNLRRQIAANTFKKKLMEMEQLCNVELARVRYSASFLEPLNKVASEWKLSASDSGDSVSRRISLTHDIHVNKVSADPVTRLTEVRSDRFSVEVNLAEVHPSCRADQLAEPFPVWMSVDNPVPKHRFPCVCRSRQNHV